jgi:hypothetical protein
MSINNLRRLIMMNKTAFSVKMLIAMTLMLLAGCNSGGNSSGGVIVQQQTEATVFISAAGTLPDGSTIGGVDLSLTLPAGVTVKATPGSLSAFVPDEGIVSASGAAAESSKVYAMYTVAAGATPGAVRILVANSTGFSTGEFVAVKCDVAGGNPPVATDFSSSAVKFVDGNGKAVTGLSTTVALK